MIAEADLAAYSELRASCRAASETFPRVVLGHGYWSKQVEAYRAMWSKDRVILQGGRSNGKSYCAADFIVDYVANTPGAKCVLLGPKHEQLRVNMWASVRAAHASARIPLGGVMGADSWTLGDQWWARIASADKPESLHLGHAEGFLIVVDEAVGLDPIAWLPIDGMLASHGTRLVLLYNPTNGVHRVRDLANNPRYHVVKFNCEEHPNVVSGSNVYPGAVTREWVEEFREAVRRGERTQDEYDAHVRGEFGEGGTNDLFPQSVLSASLDIPPVADVRRLGLDVAREGNDRNVLCFVDENRRASVVETWTGLDLMQTCGKLIAARKRLDVRPEYTFVDVCGIGGGVVDRAREQGHAVRGVDFGSKVVGDWARVVGRESQFLNRRAELYFATAALVRSKQLSVGREFWRDLSAIRSVFTSTSDLKIKDKDEIRKDLGRSPDFADALVLAFGAAAGGVWCRS